MTAEELKQYIGQDCLIAEWNDRDKTYRVYEPEYPEWTCAYDDNTYEIKHYAAIKAYSRLIVIRANGDRDTYFYDYGVMKYEN